jgi:hypothetical protein
LIHSPGPTCRSFRSRHQSAKLQGNYYAFAAIVGDADAAALCAFMIYPCSAKIVAFLFFAADFSAKYMNIFEHFCACSCNVFYQEYTIMVRHW